MTDSEGLVRCGVDTDALGWRRVCDGCGASIFNVYLTTAHAGPADADVSSGGCNGRGGGLRRLAGDHEVCIDCWSGMSRGDIDWPPLAKSKSTRVIS